jgi:ABC-2 type transport system ATP-binding protein
MAGFVDAPGFYGYLSARDNLKLLAAADKRKKESPLERVLETVGLSERARDKVKTYSTGMKQRLAIAAALLREPEFLILDEPTNGLDPGGMRDVRALIRRLAGEGLTIFLSSHLLAEVEQLCSRVGVLDRGRLVLQDDLARLTAPTGSTVVRTPAPDRVRATLDGRVTEIDGDRVVVRGEDPAEVNARLVSAGVPVTGLALERPTLEQVVLAAARATADRVDAPSGGGR